MTPGIAFLKSATGRAYFGYYGEQLSRTDLSISVTGLGSPLEHTGAVGAAERNAARVCTWSRPGTAWASAARYRRPHWAQKPSAARWPGPGSRLTR